MKLVCRLLPSLHLKDAVDLYGESDLTNALEYGHNLICWHICIPCLLGSKTE